MGALESKYMRYTLLLATCFLLLLATSGFTKSWNNITPLKTTRAEVIGLLGEPKPFQGKGSEYFAFEGQKIFFDWARPNCYKLGSIKIDEKLAGPEALVYGVMVEPGDSNQDKYEAEVREFLTAIEKSDCIGSHNGACGISDFSSGFSYSRSDRGITRLQYHASEAESNDWFHTLIPCSQSKPTQ